MKLSNLQVNGERKLYGSEYFLGVRRELGGRRANLENKIGVGNEIATVGQI
jgi:hypothetical protein